MTLPRQQDSCVSVRSVFEVERRLSAPLYQRRFSWDRKNLDEFWEDIRLVEEGESEALFLGAIILKHEGPSDPSAGVLEEFLVLDGQQRIATCSLRSSPLRSSGKSTGTQTKLQRSQRHS